MELDWTTCGDWGISISRSIIDCFFAWLGLYYGAIAASFFSVMTSSSTSAATLPSASTYSSFSSVFWYESDLFSAKMGPVELVGTTRLYDLAKNWYLFGITPLLVLDLTIIDELSIAFTLFYGCKTFYLYRLFILLSCYKLDEVDSFCCNELAVL